MIETPPYFHPQQAADAVAAGKHVFLAKPIAVDVPGCQSVAESGKRRRAKKKVFLVDFQTRVNPFYVEAVKRVHAGGDREAVELPGGVPVGRGRARPAGERRPRSGCGTGTTRGRCAAT